MSAKQNTLFFRHALIVLGLAAAAGLLLLLSDVILLIFGAVLVSVILHAISEPINRHTKIPQRWALFIAILLIICAFLIAGWMMGSIVTHQLSELGNQLPTSWEAFKIKIGQYQYGDELVHRIENFHKYLGGQGITAGLGIAAFSVVDGIANFLVVIVCGVFIAAQPALYKNGILKLLPKGRRVQAQETMDISGRALRLWFVGKLISMLCIGMMIAIVFLALGLPSALALGLLAGIGEFIPYIGSFLAIVPALLLASTQGAEMVLIVLVAFIIVQQIQGNLVTPLVQQRMVSLPPALTIFALVISAVLFGPIGLLFAEPLTVFFFVLVKKLYVRDHLGEKTTIPGERKR